jgi:hypothetical protein
MVFSRSARGRVRAGFASAVAGAIATLGFASVASASCPVRQFTQPFTPWGDAAPYVAAPDGGFEAGATGWRLSGGAAVQSGNEPFHVASAADARSLKLPAGSAAQMPAVCIDIAHPTLRLFARNTGSALSTLVVSVGTINLLGLRVWLPVGTVTGGSSWGPSLPVPVLVNLLQLTGGSNVVFRFAPAGGAWSIDDVYVDPYVRG